MADSGIEEEGDEDWRYLVDDKCKAGAGRKGSIDSIKKA